MSSKRHHAEWLSLIDVSGPFLTLPVLERVFPQGLEGHDPEQARTLRVWARFDVQQGRTEEGHRKSEAARNMFKRLSMPLAAEKTDTWL